MRQEHQAIVDQLVALLRPLKGTGEPYYLIEDHADQVGPDEPVRDVVREVLRVLEVESSGGCRLCLS